MRVNIYVENCHIPKTEAIKALFAHFPDLLVTAGTSDVLLRMRG